MLGAELPVQKGKGKGKGMGKGKGRERDGKGWERDGKGKASRSVWQSKTVLPFCSKETELKIALVTP